jgi:hypothetical protein
LARLFLNWDPFGRNVFKRFATGFCHEECEQSQPGLASSLPPRKRDYVFGAGVIVSNALVGIQFAYVLVAGFTLPAVLLGTLFFLGTVATELMFSTKVGDLGKMRREFEKQVPRSAVAGHSLSRSPSESSFSSLIETSSGSMPRAFSSSSASFRVTAL